MPQLLRKLEPKFVPVKLVLKDEDDDGTGNTFGPLFYHGANLETSPVFVDLNEPSTIHSTGYFPAWFTMEEAQKIGREMNLKVETI